MAAVVNKSFRTALLCAKSSAVTPRANLSIKSKLSAMPRWQKALLAAVGGGTAVAVGVASTLQASVMAGDLILHPPSYPWDHNRKFRTLDHAGIRRGYTVYKQVCAACHSMTKVHYRDLVDVCFTADEAKAQAAEAMIPDGPNEDGEMFLRPGKLADNLPYPYPNNEAAAAANGGAIPPDLTFIVMGRGELAGEGEDYIFSLLTGYCDPPAGVELRDGLHYNPYMLGGAIAMAQQLYPESVEYDDGTPASIPQMAKDVVTFLKWAGEFEYDERRRLSLKAGIMLAVLAAGVYYGKRHRFMGLRNRVVAQVKRK